jgi:hypothetical protein
MGLVALGYKFGDAYREEQRRIHRRATRRTSSGSSSGGSTMYDRRARSGHEPAGASGYVELRGPDAGYGHGTQYYDDGYRLSRDTDGQGDSAVHWTDDKIPKGRRHYEERHTPPPDAIY